MRQDNRLNGASLPVYSEGGDPAAAQEVLGQVHLNLAATLASGRDALTSVHDRDGILLPPCAIFAFQ